MAILIDANQVFISSILSQSSANKYNVLEEDLVRHVVLNSLRSNVSKFRSEYGSAVVCLDSKKYWRKEVFPHYKSHRKENREKSPLDWNVIFKVLNELKDDLKTYFPYKVIEVEGAEADDVIAVLTPRISNSEKVLILSSDRDFLQLQKYKNVKQYNPMLGVFVTSKDPLRDLKEKVIRGDRGDNIMNILSGDDVFATKTRQKPISSKNIVEWLDKNPKECFNEEVYRNYVRNDTLINFENIPQDIKEAIVNEFESVKPSTKNDLYKYLVSKKMVTLLECLNEF